MTDADWPFLFRAWAGETITISFTDRRIVFARDDVARAIIDGHYERVEVPGLVVMLDRIEAL